MPKKYVLIQNHVREIVSPPYNQVANGDNEEVISLEKRKKRKHSDKKPSQGFYKDDDNKLFTTEEISDIKELREIYFRCKELLHKIETKYGNRLNLFDDELVQTFSERKANKLTNASLSSSDKTCTCNFVNKKIIFDKSGNKTVVVDLNESKHHICMCKQLESQVKKSTNHINSEKAAVTRCNDSEPLFPGPITEDIKELSQMLTDTELDPILRYRVIEKIKEIRLQVLSELKLNKCSIMKKLRDGDSDIINFHGTNLMSMSGYLEPFANEDKKKEGNDL